MKLSSASVFGLLSLTLQASALPSLHDAASKDSILRQHDDSFTPDVILRITYETISIGCTRRESAVINGSLPGPEVRIPAGKTTWIRVYNDIPYHNTTVHWHGLSQRTAAFSDGSPSVSQWPIPPHHFFDYEVHPEANDAGSYFYHSHVGFQMSTASGPLIVEDVGKPPYEYDEECIVLLGDYFAKSDTAIQQGLTSTPFEWSGEASAVLINGVGVPMGEDRGGVNCPQPIIHVDPGKTYRFRFISATSLSMVRFGISEHPDLTIIAADGQYTKAHPVNFLQISSGQRFDVLLKTKSEHEIRKENTGDWVFGYRTIDSVEEFSGIGYLSYSGFDLRVCDTKDYEHTAYSISKPYEWLEYALEPLSPNNFPTADQVTRRIIIYARQLTTTTAIWQLNGAQWNESTPYIHNPSQQPYLVNIYKQGWEGMPNYDAAIANGG